MTARYIDLDVSIVPGCRHSPDNLGFDSSEITADDVVAAMKRGETSKLEAVADWLDLSDDEITILVTVGNDDRTCTRAEW